VRSFGFRAAGAVPKSKDRLDWRVRYVSLKSGDVIPYSVKQGMVIVKRLNLNNLGDLATIERVVAYEGKCPTSREF
jgi:hypothetical protein